MTSLSGVTTLTIANGQTVSSAMGTRGYTMFGVMLPAAFTGTAISYQVCDTLGGSYQAVYNSAGSLISITVAQGRSYMIPDDIKAWPFFKIVSNASEGAARSLKVVARGV